MTTNPTASIAATTPAPLRIDFVSDVACPWCAVGLHSLGQALQTLAGEVSVELHFQPFELNPDLGAQGVAVPEYLKAKYGLSEEQIRANQAVIRQRGAAVGFQFGERSHVWNTFDAHRLLYWAASFGKQLELKHALLHAYHGEGRNPGDHAVLLELVAAVGLDTVAAQAALASDQYRDEVRALEQQWQAAGIHAVPAVVINQRHLIQGGQAPEVFVQALRQIAQTQAQAV